MFFHNSQCFQQSSKLTLPNPWTQFAPQLHQIDHTPMIPSSFTMSSNYVFCHCFAWKHPMQMFTSHLLLKLIYVNLVFFPPKVLTSDRCLPDHSMALTVNLIGPSPWGFRICGGRDFKRAITVSKVPVGFWPVAEPRHTLSNYILLFLSEQSEMARHAKSTSSTQQFFFLSLFVSMGSSVPISLTTEPVRIEWK